MDIRCGKCSQKYHLPDDQVDDRRVYFFCENCGHRIVIDRKKEPWHAFRVPEQLTKGSDILEGIFLSFNGKNFLTSFLFLLSWSIIVTLAGLVASHNRDFFSGHTLLSAFIVIIMALVFTWTFDVHLYMLSRNTLFRMKHGKNVSFGDESPVFSRDTGILAFTSMAVPFLFFILILPVFLVRNEYAAAYGGFFHGLMLAAALAAILLAACRHLFQAYMALKPRSLGETVKGFFRFLAVENINIPVYMMLISVITLFCAGMVFLFCMTALGITMAATGAMLPSFVPGQGILPGSGLLPSAPSVTEAAESIQGGLVMAGFWISLFFIAFISWTVNLVQSLATMSVKIMESNPGRSLGRGILLAGLLAATGTVLLVIAVVSHNG